MADKYIRRKGRQGGDIDQFLKGMALMLHKEFGMGHFCQAQLMPKAQFGIQENMLSVQLPEIDTMRSRKRMILWYGKEKPFCATFFCVQILLFCLVVQDDEIEKAVFEAFEKRFIS